MNLLAGQPSHVAETTGPEAKRRFAQLAVSPLRDAGVRDEDYT
ncbi:hypothetical protein VTO73DRAFT_12142 [Trametes versicolor]